ncbi:MAG: hypothetical protein Q9182_006706 [Xanthomendoza sp. 2 TL-2023]
MASATIMTDDEFNERLRSSQCTAKAPGLSEEQIFDPPAPPPNPAPVVDHYAGFHKPPEVAHLEAAASTHNLAKFKEVYETWHDPDPRENHLLLPFEIAIAEDNFEIASYIFDQGFLTTFCHFERVLKKEAYHWMQFFLDRGYDLNLSWYDYGTTALGHALHSVPLTRWLLDRGADPNAESRIKRTPLSRAVQERSLDMIRLLMEYGGPDSINHGFLLLCAIWRKLPDHMQVLEYVLDEGAERHVNEASHSVYPDNCVLPFQVPLQEAAGSGKLDAVKLLLARGADPRILDGRGLLAVDVAREKHHDEVVQYLAPLCTQSSKL